MHNIAHRKMKGINLFGGTEFGIFRGQAALFSHRAVHVGTHTWAIAIQMRYNFIRSAAASLVRDLRGSTTTAFLKVSPASPN